MELSLWLYVIGILALFSELTVQVYKRKDQEITTFPTDIPADTTEIDLHDNEINSFPDDAFKKFDKLIKLNVGKNPFTEMPDLAPVGDTLKVLKMRTCKLTEVNANICNELIALKELDLYGNKINSFPDDAFDEFYHLENLNIGKNPLTQMPNLAPVGDTLKVLEMQACKLTELNASIFNELVALKELDLYGNNIDSFTDDAFKVSDHLRKLIIGKNPLTEKPNLAPVSDTLKVLEMRKCKLTELNASIFNELVALKELDLYDNNIDSFPDDAINELYHLEKLNIGKNPFTHMPNLAPVGDTLRVLDMKFCKLTELNASLLDALVVLEQILLNFCLLTSFPDVPGPGNTLSRIDCRGCNISTFLSLSNYKTLTYISLGSNPMTHVPEAAVVSLQVSGKLYLHDTAIASLPDYQQAYADITSLWLHETDVSFFLVSMNILINSEIICHIITNVQYRITQILR